MLLTLSKQEPRHYHSEYVYLRLDIDISIPIILKKHLFLIEILLIERQLGNHESRHVLPRLTIFH